MEICDFSIVTLVINNICYLRHDKYFFVTVCDTAVFNIMIYVFLIFVQCTYKKKLSYCHYTSKIHFGLE